MSDDAGVLPVAAAVGHAWRHEILPTLTEYIAIPNVSPAYAADWAETGHMERATALLHDWVTAQGVRDLHAEVVRLPGRTPLLWLEIPGTAAGTVLMYGHLDKQPPMEGWAPGLGPWHPVVRDGRLYGRGGADDGYAVFACVTALRALQDAGGAHARCVVLIEACEESGSYDLPPYLDALADRIGTPELVICLDSGCGDYERLWLTTSLRGLLTGDLTVSMLREGVHSGAASGIVPSTFRIARQLLDRLEDAETGDIRPPEFHVDIPSPNRAQIEAAAAVLGAGVAGAYPFVDGAGPVSEDPATLLANRTWRPQLEIVGADGLPSARAAGNVLRPSTTLKLSLRLPPTADDVAARRHLQTLLERDPPSGAAVRFAGEQSARGWCAPPLAPWLDAAIDAASRAAFDAPYCALGEGGSIPFMAMLGERYPDAQFVITGVLGPGSNAHGPNEFLHLATAEKLTVCVASLLAAHARRA